MIKLIDAILFLYILARWALNAFVRLIVLLTLGQLWLILFITIVGIPFALALYEWEKSTLNPLLDKFFSINPFDFAVVKFIWERDMA